MSLSKITAWSAGIAGALLVAALLALLVLFTVEIPVNLDPLKGDVCERLSQTLGRKVSIKGQLNLLISWWPKLEATEIHIASPPGWRNPQFVRAKLLSGQAALFPLLAGKIKVAEFTAHDVDAFLEIKKGGENNWSFLLPAKNKKPTAPPAAQASAVELVELRQLSLRRVKLSLRDGPAGRVFRLNLDELIGRAAEDKSLVLSLKGTVQRRPYSLTIKGPPPADLIASGKPWPLSIKGKIVHSPLQGSFVYHPAQQKVKVGAQLKLSAQNINLGAVGRWLGLDKELKISAGDIGLDATLRGRSLADVLKYSVFKLEVRDGLWLMREPSTQKLVNLIIKKGVIQAGRNKPISASLAGSLRKIPLDVEITSLKLADFAKPITRLSLSVKARIGKLKVRVDGQLAAPLASGQSLFNISLAGQRLDHMNQMLRVKLPGLGPYDISGRLGVSSAGYKLDGLKIHVGKSDLVGQASISAPGKRPLLKMKLTANILRLDDFIPPKLKQRHVRIYPGATSKSRTKPAKPAAKPEPGWEIKTDRQRNRIESILSRAVLNSLDGSLELKVGQVLSGKDKLGGGVLRARLHNGRLDLNPVRLDIPGGSLKLTASYQHAAGEVEAAITAKMDRFDYGVLARRMDPKSAMDGLVSVAVNLKSRAKERTDLMANASGRLIFAAWPKGRAAGLFDVWAINLLSAIVSDLTNKEKSKVNCLVCDLEMKNGVMKQRDIIIDTTKMRVKGEAEINFKTEMVNAYLDPEAKKAQFFSLSAPIRIKGSFADFDTRIATGGMTTSAIRFLTSPFFAPLLRLFGDSPPADGSDVCVEPFLKLKAREEKEKE
jgi:uncharacterized protein involved in outer membrane biogenesis